MSVDPRQKSVLEVIQILIISDEDVVQFLLVARREARIPIGEIQIIKSPTVFKIFWVKGWIPIFCSVMSMMFRSRSLPIPMICFGITLATLI